MLKGKGVTKMAGARVVRSSKEIMGVDDFVGAEWDAGYVPFGAAHRRCRVTVRKDASDCWTIYAVAAKGDEKLASWEIRSFPCETCAKAYALDLVFGDGYATCVVHGKDGFHEGDTFAGRFAMLCCLMGIDKATYNALSTGSMHRIAWVTRLILDRQIDWQKAVKAWEVAEQFALQRGISLDGAISAFYAEAVKIEVRR